MTIAAPPPVAGNHDDQLSAAVADALSDVLPDVVARVIESQYALEEDANVFTKVKAARAQMCIQRVFDKLRDDDRFLSMETLPDIVGMSRRWILEQVKLGNFPEPIRVSGRRNLWRMSAIQAWMDGFEKSRKNVKKPTDICQKTGKA